MGYRDQHKMRVTLQPSDHQMRVMPSVIVMGKGELKAHPLDYIHLFVTLLISQAETPGNALVNSRIG